MKTQRDENDPEFGPTPGQRKALKDLLKRGIISQADIERLGLETLPHAVVTEQMARWMGWKKHQPERADPWLPTRRKIIERLIRDGLTIGTKVQVFRGKRYALVSDIVKEIAVDGFVHCQRLGRVRPTEIRLLSHG